MEYKGDHRAQTRERVARWRAQKKAATAREPAERYKRQVRPPAPDVDVYRPDFDFSIHDPSKPDGLSDYGLWLIIARGYDD